MSVPRKQSFCTYVDTYLVLLGYMRLYFTMVFQDFFSKTTVTLLYGIFLVPPSQYCTSLCYHVVLPLLSYCTSLNHNIVLHSVIILYYSTFALLKTEYLYFLSSSCVLPRINCCTSLILWIFFKHFCNPSLGLCTSKSWSYVLFVDSMFTFYCHRVYFPKINIVLPAIIGYTSYSLCVYFLGINSRYI
jgi:hypothetical protein